MPTTRRQTPTPVTADPLADLRADVDKLADALEVPLADPPPLELLTGRPLAADQVWHDAAVARVVQVWHDDLTAKRYAHKGGTCGCRYLATMALEAAVGIAAPEVSDDAGA